MRNQVGGLIHGDQKLDFENDGMNAGLVVLGCISSTGTMSCYSLDQGLLGGVFREYPD